MNLSKSTIHHAIANLSLAAFASVGIAQETQPAATSPADDTAAQLESPDGSTYEFTALIGAWVPRMGGDVSLDGIATNNDVSLHYDLDLDSSEAVLDVNLSLRKNDRFQLDLNGFDFSTEAKQSYAGPTAGFGSLVLNPGDSYRATFDLASAALEFTYWPDPLREYGEVIRGRPQKVDLRLGPMAAIRWLDVDQSLEIADEGRVDAGGEWLGFLAGVNLQMRYELPLGFPLIDIVEINGNGAVGPALGGEDGFITQIRAGLSLLVTENAGFTFGYRLLNMNVAVDDYELDGGLQGLFFAATVRF